MKHQPIMNSDSDNMDENEEEAMDHDDLEYNAPSNSLQRVSFSSDFLLEEHGKINQAKSVIFSLYLYFKLERIF